MLGQNGTSHEMKEFVKWRSAEVELELKSLSPKVESRHHRLLVESPNHATEIWTSLNPVFVKSLHSMVPQVKLAGLQE